MNIPVFLPSDNNYSPYCAVTIASICHNTREFVNFYILDGGISNENKQNICKLKKVFNNFSIEFLETNLDKYFLNFNIPQYLNLATYSRLLISILKPELEKVLYFDTDTVIMADIKELFETDMEVYSIAAAWDSTRKFYNNDTKEVMELSDDYKYFNAGVLIIDIKKWIKDDVVSKLFEIYEKYNNKIPHADESLLNKYFDNNYKILDIKWNYLDYDSVNSPEVKPAIRHFATPFKPWNSNFCFAGKKPIPLKNFDDFWKYAKMTPFFEQIKSVYEEEMNTPFKKRLGKVANFR